MQFLRRSRYGLARKAFLPFLIVLFPLALYGCGSSEPTLPIRSATIRIPTVTQPPSILENTPAASTETASPGGTSTPDNRLPPEQWRKWLVVPVLSQKVQDVFRSGAAQGNDPRSFSKVGDCQNIKEAFLGVYDKPGQYALPDKYSYLQETIDYYAGSFNRDGMAVKGGFNAATVLSPLWSDPSLCLPGETPLGCEIRVHKPSILIISLEVWFKERTAARYESYIRQIIEYALAHGVVPVLATKADNMEGDNSINLTTAKLAYSYDLPLWNFWLAVQPLPDHGIDPTRDGFHISVDAWNVRSFTALQVLDEIRRDVAQDAGGSTPAAVNAADTSA
jgi:hypothetical protein